MPENRGLRFSRKAAAPSAKPAVAGERLGDDARVGDVRIDHREDIGTTFSQNSFDLFRAKSAVPRICMLAAGGAACGIVNTGVVSITPAIRWIASCALHIDVIDQPFHPLWK